MWEAEALHTAPGFKTHTTLKGQASCFSGQEHPTRVHPVTTLEGCTQQSLGRATLQTHMLAWVRL